MTRPMAEAGIGLQTTSERGALLDGMSPSFRWHFHDYEGMRILGAFGDSAEATGGKAGWDGWVERS